MLSVFAFCTDKLCVRKEPGEMRKNSVMVLGVLVSLLLIGCMKSQEKQGTVISETSLPKLTEEVTITESVNEEEEYPYEVTIRSCEIVDEAKDGEFVYFTSRIDYPVFEGNYADNLNRFVTGLLEGFSEELVFSEESAALDYTDSKEGSFTGFIFPETDEFTVSCLWAKERIEVFLVKRYSNAGGVHPNTTCKAYVVDRTVGKEKSIEEVIQLYKLTTEDVVSYAVEKIKEEYGEMLLFSDDDEFLENQVSSFAQSNQWYLNDKGLVLFANPYDIAPYAAGMIECEISYEVLEEGLKKK